jgi:macrolide transport system ATP-binding/permease protein
MTVLMTGDGPSGLAVDELAERSTDEAHNTEPLIELRALTKMYGTGDLAVEVLRGVSLKIFAGEFLAIMGASGSGKTTLMNLIGCLDRLTAGRYVLAGRDVSTLDRDQLAALRRETFGFVFQRYNLLATATATENVELPAVYAGMSRHERIRRAQRILNSLGLGHRLDHPPGKLSGGQQQRVAIARALMNGGRVILADEPTGALDSTSGKEVMDLLHRLHGQGHTIILVTHNPDAAQEAERVVKIEDGRIVTDSAPAGVMRRSVWDSALMVNELPMQRNAGLPSFSEAVKTALRSLKTNPLRTTLTMLGIVIGVGSVVAMLALGNGAKQQVLSRIEAMGTNLVLVRPGAPNVRGAGATTTTLVAADADAIATLPGVVASVPELIGPITVRYGNLDYTTSANATGAEFTLARTWPTSQGTFFSDADVTGYAPVAVLGQTVYDQLFTNGADPVGQYMLFGTTPFQIVGVLSTKGADPTGNDLDDMVWIPISTGSVRVFGRSGLRSVSVLVADADQRDAVIGAINTLLLDRHMAPDFRTQSMAALLEAATETQNTLTLLLGSIAAISLLVGGIGIMNIMLVSVTERTREIGIRMATGARSFDVLTQFVTEAVVACSIGGVIGVAGGLAVAWVASRFGSAVVFSLPPVLIAFGCTFATALVFGYFPAKRAAQLDPVVALSTE